MRLEPRSVIHAEELFDVLSEPRLYEFIEEEPPVSVQALRAKLARSESRRSPDGSQHWLNWVVRDESHRIAGYVQTTIMANGEAHVAYMLGSAFWGRGLGSQAVAAMIAMVAAEFGVRTFNILAERTNVQSVRLAERLGFVAVSAQVSSHRNIVASDVLLQKLVDA
jgi:RimJ/RimL family protein N-acetyltransferase